MFGLKQKTLNFLADVLEAIVIFAFLAVLLIIAAPAAQAQTPAEELGECTWMAQPGRDGAYYGDITTVLDGHLFLYHSDTGSKVIKLEGESQLAIVMQNGQRPLVYVHEPSGTLWITGQYGGCARYRDN